jgi:hypothetical protein
MARSIALFVSAVMSIAAAHAADRSAVAVFRDRFDPPECVDPERLTDRQAAMLSAIWAWSADTPPARAEGRSGGTTTRPMRITVRVEGAPGSMLTLRAAPVAMWEEVAEDLLPATTVALGREGFAVVRVPVDGRSAWRLRLTGAGQGSWWTDVPRTSTSVTLTATAAVDRTVRVIDEHGEPIPRTRLSLLDSGAERGDFRKLADFRTGIDGRLQVKSIPDLATATLLFAADQRAPLVLERTPPEIPAEVTLPRGGRVIGRLTTEDGTPVRDAAVEIRTWASDLLPLPFVRASRTDSQGRWALTALPKGKGEWHGSGPGFADEIRPIDLSGDAADLGTIVLSRGATAELVASDDAGQPVAHASVAAGGRRLAETDTMGRAVLRLRLGQAIEAELSAPHFISAHVSLQVPTAKPLRVLLRRAFRVTGRFVDAGGAPVPDGRARTRQESRLETHTLEPDGRFDLDLEPGRPYQVELFSPGTPLTKVEVKEGQPGENRELGDVAAPPGLLLHGRLVRAADHLPVAGGHVWLPRPTESGPLMAWAFRDLIETTSTADGSFALSGVPATPFVLRVDAPALAGTRRQVAPEPGASEVDLGDVELQGGATVVVALDRIDSRDAVARIDTAGSGLSIDMLSAPFVEGKARIANVPSGRLMLSAWRRRDMLCRQQIEVPAAGEEIEVPCSARRVAVNGFVEAGGRRVSAGTLVWLTPVVPDVPAGIFSFGSGAAQQQHVFSPESARETAEIRTDGGFEARVFPGAWDVIWMPDGGRALGPRTVIVPDAASWETTLAFPGVSVEGVVVDANGRPVKGAAVREIGGQAFAISGEDGTFTLTGAEAGTWRLVARHDGASSPVAEVAVEPGAPHPRVELVLNASEGRARVAVFGENGAARGAMVFLETDGGRLDLASADQNGNAEFHLSAPYPARIRAAASFEGRWALGEWVSWESAAERPIALRGGAAGNVVVHGKAGGALTVTSGQGWRIDQLMKWVGAFLDLQPDSDVAVNGLPAGDYVIATPAQRRTVTVQPAKTARLDLE